MIIDEIVEDFISRGIPVNVRYQHKGIGNRHYPRQVTFKKKNKVKNYIPKELRRKNR